VHDSQIEVRRRVIHGPGFPRMSSRVPYRLLCVLLKAGLAAVSQARTLTVLVPIDASPWAGRGTLAPRCDSGPKYYGPAYYAAGGRAHHDPKFSS
jgi:hypothetical protein